MKKVKSASKIEMKIKIKNYLTVLINNMKFLKKIKSIKNSKTYKSTKIKKFIYKILIEIIGKIISYFENTLSRKLWS